MKISLRFWGDHRSPEQKAKYATIEQQRADVRLELEYNRRVRANIFRRQVGEISLFRKQAS